MIDVVRLSGARNRTNMYRIPPTPSLSLSLSLATTARMPRTLTSTRGDYNSNDDFVSGDVDLNGSGIFEFDGDRVLGDFKLNRKRHFVSDLVKDSNLFQDDYLITYLKTEEVGK
ncbi:hypothetical protein RHMOL_Rhmol02G0228400 [Rhododendron molle]|uniref:Uncharacterized protein n=1 Tax=Rhododendron molle TaxID=49168 RepID=A0ACC0PUH7_RHOML|nr:hypothetical protein RHMOL_Rhmol02G0228400 [Rhododendron molle]